MHLLSVVNTWLRLITTSPSLTFEAFCISFGVAPTPGPVHLTFGTIRVHLNSYNFFADEPYNAFTTILGMYAKASSS